MIKLNYIKLNNIVVYKDAYFEFFSGISIINGNNGSGKSLLFSLLSNVFYDSHPLTGKKDSSISNGVIELSFNINNDNYILIYDYNKSLKIRVIKNNEDLKFETLTAARDYIDTLKIKEDLFFISVYLTSYRPHPLLYGNFTTRFDFFESLFDLSKLDELLDRVKKRIRILEDNKVKKETLEQELLQIDKRLETLDETKLNDKKKRLEEDVKNLKEDNTKKSKLLDIYNSLESQLNKINKLEGLIKEAQKPDASQDLLKQLKYKDINEDLDKIDDTYFTDILLRSQNVTNKLEELKQKLSYIETLKVRIKETTDSTESVKRQVTNEDLLSLSEIRQKLTTEIEILKDTLSKRLSLQATGGTYKCDKCGSIVSSNKLNAEIQETKTKLEIKQKEFSDVNDKFNKSNELMKKIESLNNNLKNLNTELKNNNSQLELLTTKLSTSSFKILSTLSTLSTPSSNLNEDFISSIINKLTSLNDLVNEDKKIMKQRQDIIKLSTLRDNYKDLINNINPDIKSKMPDINLYDVNDISKQQRILQNEISQGLNAGYQLDKELQDTMLNLGIVIHSTQRKTEIQTNLRKINEDLQDIVYYKTLEGILGPKEFKEYKMKYNIKKFESLLNKYSTFLFDDMTFELQLEKRALSIIAIRNGVSSDVNKLSGSESRRFCLLVLIATLSLIDSKNKCDTLFLDEMDNGLDSNFKNKFYKSFLPELQKIIPKIIIITPDSDIPVNYTTNNYIVKKEQDRSIIIKYN